MEQVYTHHLGLLSPVIDFIRIRKVDILIESGRKVLDVGCGPAFLVERLKNRCDYTGVDYNPEIVEANRRRFPGTKFEYFDAMKRWPFNDNTFDTVVITGVLEHLHSRIEMLSEAARVLVPGGQFLATTPSRIGGWLHDILASIHLFSHHAAEDHKDFLDGATMRRLAAECHLEVERIELFELGFNQLFVLRKPSV